jgi:hypothetical protein
MREAILPLNQYVSTAWYLIKHKENFTLISSEIMKDNELLGY